jgi:hypothetical protein
MPIAGHALHNPDVRRYRIRLLPWVVNAKRWFG